jgi:ABC-type phosphate transport system auxiliary subunit
VPVTARLSRKFYETFGEEIANELVDWFNAVDLTYRADLRELNELNFARFDAKLEQRIAQSEARMERRLSELGTKLERLKAELVRWMFLFWVGSVGLALGINALG